MITWIMFNMILYDIIIGWLYIDYMRRRVQQRTCKQMPVANFAFET